MQSNYKRLGDYIRLVDERNRNLEVKNLTGLTINKVFIPSVANTVGTDMSTYKIIRKNQFACSTMQVRRDKKIPVALWKDSESAIISAAYPVFEIMDEQQLFPEYLMMWFSRSEFDREACFLAVGGVRGSLEWEDFLNMEFPLPTLEKQKELVAEYQTVEERIQLNNQLCEKLEETAQTIYRHWFEDFEFPNDNGDPYKSSGGAMVYNEELGKEIPEGWKVGKLEKISSIKAGGDRPQIFSENKTEICQIPIYSNGIERDGLYGFTDKAKVEKRSITVSARGTIGFCCLREKPFVPIVRLIVITPNETYFAKYLKDFLTKIDYNDSGSVQSQLTAPEVEKIDILIPESTIVEQYDGIISHISQKQKQLIVQNKKLEELKSLLLGKMAVEG